MKNFTISLIIAIFLSLLLAVCNDDETARIRNKKRLQKLKSKSQDTVEQEFDLFFKTFERNLDLIEKIETPLSQQTIEPELVKQQRDQIFMDIQMINELLEQNQFLIKDLKNQFATNNDKLAPYHSLLDSLQIDLDRRTHQNQLRQKLIVESNTPQLSDQQEIDSLGAINQGLLSFSRIQDDGREESNTYSKIYSICLQNDHFLNSKMPETFP